MKHHKSTSGRDIAKAAMKLWKKLEPDVWKPKKEVKQSDIVPIEQKPNLSSPENRQKRYAEENHIKVKWR